VLPVSEEAVTLCAELADGTLLAGESRIESADGAISRLWLSPPARPAPGVLEAIAEADAIVLGPGSLYTSILPNLLVDGVAEAVRRSGALRIFVCNLLTQPGETAGFDAVRHLEALQSHLGPGAVDICLVNDRVPSPDVVARYARSGAEPVRWDNQAIASSGVLPIVGDLAEEDGALNRHDPMKLAEMVVALARCLRRVARLAPREEVAVAASAGGARLAAAGGAR
jgi:uncharacterized cofD-like protein